MSIRRFRKPALAPALAIAALLMVGGTVAASAQKVTLPPRPAANYAQDRAEIEELMARYLFAIDYFDWDAYVGTFTEDGELAFASGKTKGREAIRTTVAKFSETIGKHYHTEDGKAAMLRHVILQSSIRVEGDRAWGRSLWLEMANHGPKDTMKMGTYGIYEDEFRKVNGQWLIARRNVLNEFIKGRQSGPANPVGVMDALAAASRAGR
jgi:ketosteroid isomerase-like protein